MCLSHKLIQLDKTSHEKIECFIKDLDNDFVPPLSSRVNIAQWSRKLNNFAANIGKVNALGDLEALISFYPNRADESYIALLAVSKSQRSKGMGSALLDYCINYCSQIGSTCIKVNTWLTNYHVIDLYHSKGFIDYEIKKDHNSRETLFLEKEL